MAIPEPTDTVATPAALIHELQDLIGPEAVARWCAALLAGGPVAPGQPSLAWFGHNGADLTHRGLEGDDGRAGWVRTWAARGLLHGWDQSARAVAVPAVIDGLSDDAWRVREMSAKVVRRWRVTEAATALDKLQHDEVARVRTAAAKALEALAADAGGFEARSARTSTSGNARTARTSTSGNARTARTSTSEPARSSRPPTRPKPITPSDFRRAARDAIKALRAGADLDWSRPAANVSWSCAQVGAHLTDDFVAFALQLAGEVSTGYLPFRFGPARGTAPAGLLDLVDATAAVLAATAAGSAPGTRGYHPYGVTGAEGFLALATGEVLVHSHDIAAGLDVPYEPPAAQCRRVLARLLPGVELAGDDPWEVLCWATGRLDLPGRDHVHRWHWQVNPT